MKRGLFIVFEGIDGSGKTTQARLLAKRLKAVLTEEPTNRPLGRFAKKIIKKERAAWVQAVFAKDRAWHVKKVIQPALKKKRTVICDRYILSSLAYADKRDVKVVKALNAKFPKPDITFLLNVPVKIAMKRKKSGFSRRDLERIRRNYLRLKGKARVIDGTKSKEEISEKIFTIANNY